MNSSSIGGVGMNKSRKTMRRGWQACQLEDESEVERSMAQLDGSGWEGMLIIQVHLYCLSTENEM